MKKLCLLLGAVTILGACKKGNDSPPAASRTDLLTAKPWLTSSVAITANGLPVPSSLVVSACQLDNTYKFNADKTLVVDEGATRCSATDPQTQTGTWTFANTDQTKITITLPNSFFNGDATITELSSTTLRLNSAQTISGIAGNADITFSPK